jgi:hypothetical protein
MPHLLDVKGGKLDGRTQDAQRLCGRKGNGEAARERGDCIRAGNDAREGDEVRNGERDATGALMTSQSSVHA